MAEVNEPPPPLSPEDAARITEFARACKAAARAVVLYPAAHPAIGATLGRIFKGGDEQQPDAKAPVAAKEN